jgi:signal transduction histidine kinase
VLARVRRCRGADTLDEYGLLLDESRVRKDGHLRVAWAVWLVCAGLVAVALALLMLNAGFLDNPGIVVGQALTIVAFVLFATFGAAIRRAQPRNRIGWTFLVGGTLGALQFATGQLAGHVLAAGSGDLTLAIIAAWVFSWIQFPAIFSALALLLFLFPDGALASPRWRPILALAAATTAMITVATALAPGPMVLTPTVAWTNPFGARGGLGRPLQTLADWSQPMIAGVLGLGVISLVVRYQRSDAGQRRQIKWLVYALVLTVAIFVWFTVSEGPGPITEGIQGALFGVAVLAVPVGAGIGILKHRLYDIDRIISRTLVSGGLVAFITGIYLLVVVGIGELTGAWSNVGLPVAATAIAAVAFQPLRNWLTRVANRLVWGDKGGPLELMTRLSHEMSSVYEIDHVLSTMARVITTGVDARHGIVWLRHGSQLVASARWPLHHTDLPQPVAVGGETLPAIDGFDHCYPVRHQGTLVGALSITMAAGERLTARQDSRLCQLAQAAGLVLENVRLIEELRASRSRILAAQDAERRRIERNLHDGAQQRLANLSLALGMIRARLGPAPQSDLATALERATAEAHEALTELRDLARGLHPALLTDGGLVPAVRSLIERSPVPALLSATAVAHLSEAVASTAYYVVAELLANAIKHAAPARIDVGIAQCDGALTVQVCDDGRGDARLTLGGGLQGLADRVAALGGELQLDSAPETGTRVVAVIPCA